MTLSPLTIYLWGIADQVRDTLIPVTVFAGILAAIGIVASIGCLGEGCEKDVQAMVRKWRNLIAALFMASLLGCVAIPSFKTIAIMVVLPAIANSEPIQKDLPELYQMAVERLKAELKPEKP